MRYTLAEAATVCRINKSTVLRSVKAGRISGTKDKFGTWHVEAVELHRIFPPAAAAAASPEALPRHAPPDAATDALVAELAAGRHCRPEAGPRPVAGAGAAPCTACTTADAAACTT